jgi:hypothetical protein
MLHWVKSFSVMALFACAMALCVWSSPFAGVAVAVAVLFLALAAMAWLTGMLGRTRAGMYSGERAVWLVALAIGAVLAVDAWRDLEPKPDLSALFVYAAAER